MLELSKIESSIYTVLNPLLEQRKSGITPIHPRNLSDLKNRQSVVVMNYLDDAVEGTYISQEILQPQFTFIAYSGEYILSRRIQEVVISLMSELDANKFSTPEIKISSYTKLRRSPVMFEDSSEMYLASVDYRFFAQSCL